MEFLKNQIRFHFLYNGIPFTEHNYTVTQTETANTLTTVYTFCDGLRITNIAKKHGDAYEWVNMLENISDKQTLSKYFDNVSPDITTALNSSSINLSITLKLLNLLNIFLKRQRASTSSERKVRFNLESTKILIESLTLSFAYKNLKFTLRLFTI